MQQTFQTPEHTTLYVELGSGDVAVRADADGATTVEVHGDRADEVTVEQRGDKIVVLGPRNRGGFFHGNSSVDVIVSVPAGTDLECKLGSADLVGRGTLGRLDLRTGSGDIRLEDVAEPAEIESGSGDITLRNLHGGLRAKSGSGDISIVSVLGEATISTGSGDVEIGSAPGSVMVKTGSGDLRVREGGERIMLTTASGDVVVDLMKAGEVSARNVSGDIRVGVPGGVPVWTDVNTVTGSVRSSLEGAGQPAEGQPYVEVRATTVSGDISLEQR